MNAPLVVLALLAAPAQEPPPPPPLPPPDPPAEVADPPAPPPARTRSDDPGVALAALTGGSSAAAGAILSAGGGLMLLVASGATAEPELVAAVGATVLIATPLVTALTAGLALNLIYGGDCASYIGVLATAGYACALAYLCAAAVAVVPLLALGGGSPGGCNPGGCNGCNPSDPCSGLDINNAPRPEVTGGIVGAGVGFAVGAVLGFFFPIAVVETGGSLPPLGFLSGDPIQYGLFLGGALSVVTAGVGSVVGVVVTAPDKPKKKPAAEGAARTTRTYEIAPEPAQPAAALAF